MKNNSYDQGYHSGFINALDEAIDNIWADLQYMQNNEDIENDWYCRGQFEAGQQIITKLKRIRDLKSGSMNDNDGDVY